MPRFVQDALSIMDGLGLGTAHVIGHDWGSIVSWHLACVHPDRVRTLTAVSVPHPMAVSQARHGDGGEQKRSSEYMMLFAMAGTAEEIMLAHGGQRLWGLFEPLPREQAAAYVQPLLEPGALTGALNWYRRMQRPSLGPCLVPTTYIWGNQDFAMARSSALACADWVAADYRFVELDGISHWAPDQAPALVARAALARIHP
jgi:pimeloyl-ACP methyl ester carboxylesterase